MAKMDVPGLESRYYIDTDTKQIHSKYWPKSPLRPIHGRRDVFRLMIEKGKRFPGINVRYSEITYAIEKGISVQDLQKAKKTGGLYIDRDGFVREFQSGRLERAKEAIKASAFAEDTIKWMEFDLKCNTLLLEWYRDRNTDSRDELANIIMTVEIINIPGIFKRYDVLRDTIDAVREVMVERLHEGTLRNTSIIGQIRWGAKKAYRSAIRAKFAENKPDNTEEDYI